MADGSVRTPGSGETIASDDIGGVKHQRVKLQVGADGAAADVSTGIDGTTLGSMVPVVPMYESSGGTMYRPRTAFTGDGMATQYAPAGTPYLYNGATLDRQRGNTEGTLLASAARTATTFSAQQTNHNARGGIFTLNVTVAAGGGQTLTVTPFGYDPVSAATYGLGNFATLTATGTYAYVVYPGVAETIATTNVEVQGLILPRAFLIAVTHSAGGSWTYSLGYSLVV
jgi:hypothetical protein